MTSKVGTVAQVEGWHATWVEGTVFSGVQMGMWGADVFRRSAPPLTPLPPCPPSLLLVLRCLGIPTRVVTNFSSAHDQNSNLLIEYFRNGFGEIESNKSEMIW